MRNCFGESTGGCAFMYESVSMHPFYCVQTLNPALAKNMREKHFDRFSSRPRRGTLDVTATLFTGGRKSEERFVSTKSERCRREEYECCLTAAFPCLCCHVCVCYHAYIQSFLYCMCIISTIQILHLFPCMLFAHQLQFKQI